MTLQLQFVLVTTSWSCFELVDWQFKICNATEFFGTRRHYASRISDSSISRCWYTEVTDFVFSNCARLHTNRSSSFSYLVIYGENTDKRNTDQTPYSNAFPIPFRTSIIYGLSVIPSCSFTFARVIPSCSFTFARVIPTLFKFFVKTFLVYFNYNSAGRV